MTKQQASWKDVLSKQNAPDPCLHTVQVLALIPRSANRLLLPPVNHHWFNGYGNENVQEIERNYRNFCATESSSDVDLSHTITLTVFTPAAENQPDCAFQFENGESNVGGKRYSILPPSRYPDFFSFLTELKKKGRNFNELQEFVESQDKFFVAPIDGLHRLTVLNKLSSEPDTLRVMCDDSKAHTFNFSCVYYCAKSDRIGK